MRTVTIIVSPRYGQAESVARLRQLEGQAEWTWCVSDEIVESLIARSRERGCGIRWRIVRCGSWVGRIDEVREEVAA